MNPRYARKEMSDIWSEDNKLRVMLEIELLACEAQAELGVIPKDAPAKIRATADFDAARVLEIEKEVKHDVIAFLTSVAEHVGEDARHIHVGMTSSDLIDTCFAAQLSQASGIILQGIDRVIAALDKQVRAHRDTLCIGRSHGIHAEPTTFGVKLAGHLAAFKRAKKRMIAAREEISVCAISGAVGTYASIDPYVEEYVASKLGLKSETVSTQVIPRDRHAMFFATLGVVASSIENLAVEIRHLQRSEVREAEEFFSAGQKGSSAMPHKRNPILTENLTGLARLIRSAVIPAMENVALWHERDISHSSVERVIAPDSTVLADFALHRLAGVIENLLVYPDRMKENLESLKGLIFSQTALLALVAKGISREDAYKIVQAQAMRVWAGAGDFQSLLASDATVKKLMNADELAAVFTYDRFVRRTGEIVDRALAA
jgi:adenylosuccinate lyase